MNNISVKTGQPLKVLALILCVGVLPLVGGMTGCAGSRYKQSTGEFIDDHTLSFHVKKALGEDHQYKYGDVNVVTFKGVVQLSGFVNTKDQKNQKKGARLDSSFKQQVRGRHCGRRAG